MTARRRLLAHRHLAVLLCAATLLLRLVVPAGYMIGLDHGRPTIELCSGVAPAAMATAAAMPGPVMHGPAMHAGMDHHGQSKDHGRTEMPCAFAGLSAASLGAVDAVLLVAFVAFVMATGLLPAVLPAIDRRAYLRPPLRAPPAFL